MNFLSYLGSKCNITSNQKWIPSDLKSGKFPIWISKKNLSSSNFLGLLCKYILPTYENIKYRNFVKSLSLSPISSTYTRHILYHKKYPLKRDRKKQYIHPSFLGLFQNYSLFLGSLFFRFLKTFWKKRLRK